MTPMASPPPPPSSPPPFPREFSPSPSLPPAPPRQRRLQKSILTTLFILRFFQLAAAAIAGFIYCYLIWHHTNHYCVYWPYRCSEAQRANSQVPWQYMLATGTGIVCFLQILITSVYFILVAERVVYPVLVVTDGVLLCLYCACLRVVFDVPGSQVWCLFFSRPLDYRANVAARNCVIGQDGKGALAFAVGLTGCVVILSGIMALKECCVSWEKKKEKKKVMAEKDITNSLDDNSAPVTAVSGSRISVEIDVTAFMSIEHRMEIGIGCAAEVAEDEKPAKPIEPHPAELLPPVQGMEISEISRHREGALI